MLVRVLEIICSTSGNLKLQKFAETNKFLNKPVKFLPNLVTLIGNHLRFLSRHGDVLTHIIDFRQMLCKR